MVSPDEMETQVFPAAGPETFLLEKRQANKVARLPISCFSMFTYNYINF